jgi:hypothetical protein
MTHRMASAPIDRRSLLVVAVVAALGLSGALGCGEVDDRPASWSYIHAAIIAPSCATSNCHSSLAATAGIQLHTPEAGYLFMTGRVCGGEELPGEAPRNFVTPGSPEYSPLMYLLRGEERRIMPPDTPLPEVDIELIERWILEGAPCN